MRAGGSMAAWRSLSACGLMLAAASTPSSAARLDLGPASQEAILAGAKACVGITTDPTATAVRTAGWSPAPAGAFRTDGRALVRDHVLLAVTPGPRGACIVSARAAPSFSGRKLLADLKQLYGARLRSDAPPVLILPNGEMMRVNVGSHAGGPTYVQLALVAAKGN
jgi:hypothetical protein